MQHDSYLLEGRNISKSFYGNRALEGVDFDLRPGEVHALVGENGAGKSTLAKIFAGVEWLDQGTLAFRGRTVRFDSPAHAIDQGIVTIYQERMLVPSLTVEQNICLGHEPGRFLVDDFAARGRCLAALERLGLDLDPQTRVCSLSCHLQQMVMIAKALTYDAPVFILDEPTAALTGSETDRLFDVLHSLREHGMGMIYITHRLEELPRLADRVTVLKDGQLVDTRPAQELSKDECIRLMVGRKLETLFPEIDWTPGEVVLRAQGISRKGALSKVSFDVRRGEILGFFGLVGSGSSAAARAVYGADDIDEGTVMMDDVPIDEISPNDMGVRGVGFIPGDRKSEGLVLGFSVRDNMTLSSLDRFQRFGMLDGRMETRTARSLVDRLLVRTAGVRARVRTLSGGNQQKVVIGKTLCQEASVLIIDEPTWGIDLPSKAEIYALLADLAREGTTLLVASSDLPELIGMCHRIIVFREGRVAGEYSRGEYLEEHILQDAFADVTETGGSADEVNVASG